MVKVSYRMFMECEVVSAYHIPRSRTPMGRDVDGPSAQSQEVDFVCS